MNKYLETLSNLKDANKPVENNTELEKVELSLMNDIKRRSKALIQDKKAFLDIQRQLFDAKRSAVNLSELLTDTVNAQEKDLAEATNKLKDLGLDTKQLLIYEKQLDDIAFEIKDFKKKIK
tara:strand:- start:331 stop:693 length:363 start_codon:yes stop_codon:yes gene_type:complete